MANSLDEAVKAGTISEYAAFGDLSLIDIENLISDGFGGLQILVKGHSGREVMSASRFYETRDTVDYRVGGIRGVAGVALDYPGQVIEWPPRQRLKPELTQMVGRAKGRR